MRSVSVFIHPTACVDEPVEIGAGTKIWHFSHVMAGARVGRDAMLGQGCFVAGNVVVGNRVRVQNNVSLYDGVELEDDVFVGPSAVFTNVVRPRATVAKKDQFARTFVRRGATIGANSTIVAGITIGEHAFVAAGAVVRKDVPSYAVVAGVPAKRIGWVSRHGEKLEFDAAGHATCPATGERYHLVNDHVELET